MHRRKFHELFPQLFRSIISWNTIQADVWFNLVFYFVLRGREIQLARNSLRTWPADRHRFVIINHPMFCKKCKMQTVIKRIFNHQTVSNVWKWIIIRYMPFESSWNVFFENGRHLPWKQKFTKMVDTGIVKRNWVKINWGKWWRDKFESILIKSLHEPLFKSDGCVRITCALFRFPRNFICHR